MIDIKTWMPQAAQALRQEFGSRLIYIGLQGSYRRDEASETSDIDLVALFDHIDLPLLSRYRAVVKRLPEGEKTCGFVGGVEELYHWPRHELFSFRMDTVDYFGRLDDYLPPLTDDDAREGCRTGASLLYHMAVHTYVHSGPEERSAALAGAFKSAFFALLLWHYLQTGYLAATKCDLAEKVAGVEKELMQASLDFPRWLQTHDQDEAYSILLEFCKKGLEV
ncbi:MAG: nucleotidyltransferase domain-containing protein [Planctomycetes bacterium]|nr:nucleotidyltransferase domain-containing protein [Planctomycetota bacterium]